MKKRVSLVFSLVWFLGIAGFGHSAIQSQVVEDFFSLTSPSVIDPYGVHLPSGQLQLATVDLPAEGSLPAIARQWVGGEHGGWTFLHERRLTLIEESRGPRRLRIQHTPLLALEYEEQGRAWRPARWILEGGHAPSTPISLYELRSLSGGQIFEERHPTGEVRTFSTTASGYQIAEILRTDGWHEQYLYDGQGRVKKIHVFTPLRDHLAGWLKFRYDHPEGPDALLISSEGHQIRYRYLLSDFATHPHSPQNLRQLASVRVEGGNTLSYLYHQAQGDAAPLLAASNSEQGGSLIYEYNAHRQVMSVQTQEGVSLRTYRWEVNPQLLTILEGTGGELLIRLSSERRLLSSERRIHGQPVRSFHYVWSPEGHLLTKKLEEAGGAILGLHHYRWNERGQLVENRVEGDLTGQDWASYATAYEYEALWPYRLLATTHENGLSLRWEYHEQTTRPTSRLLFVEGKPVHRQFFTYDPSGNLVSLLMDDGSGTQRWDTTGATEQRIKSLRPRLTAPGFGLPEEVQEGYLDPHTRHMHLLKKTLNHYDARGRLLFEETLDANETCLDRVEYHYDEQGRLVDTRQGEARRHMAYDERGRVTLLTNERSDSYGSSQFDGEGRLIYVEQREPGHRFQASTFHYDDWGRKSGSTDLFGETTSYDYDALGRLTQLRAPQVPNSSGALQTPLRQYVYNALDLPEAVTDEEGFVTRLTYNLRGQVTELHYADGTVERHRFRADGQEEEVERVDGTRTRFLKDALGRVLQESHLSAQGELHNEKTYQYAGLRPTEMRDLRGVAKNLQYDGAGRVSEVVEDYGSESFQAHLSYAPQGHLQTTRFWYGYADHEFTDAPLDAPPPPDTTPPLHSDFDYAHYNDLGQNVLRQRTTLDNGTTLVTTFDTLGRRQQVQVYSSFGDLLREVEYGYDLRGYQTRETHRRVGEPLAFQRLRGHGPNGRLEWEEEQGTGCQSKRTQYLYDQQGRLAGVIKPDGVSLEYRYDEGGRLNTLVSSDGSIHYEYLYGLDDRPLTILDQRLRTSTSIEYNGREQVSLDSHSNGLQVGYTYNRLGQPLSLQLPDGSAIVWHYQNAQLERVARVDAVGREIYSQPWTISPSSTIPQDVRLDELDQLVEEPGISHQYDSLGNPKGPDIEVNALNQLVRHGELLAEYDPNGNLVRKVSASGEERFRYDALNRLIRYERTGDVAADYAYDAQNRRMEKTLWHWSADQERWNRGATFRYLYQHQKEIGCVDEEGQLVELRLLGPAGVGEIGAALAMELQGTPYLPRHDGSGNLTAILDLLSGTTKESYQYTAFGEKESPDAPLSPWRFSSKRSDPESGLVFFGSRYYDPSLGRWLTPDPLGSLDSPSPYVYARNNPLEYRDPYGLFSITDSMASWVSSGLQFGWDFVQGMIRLSEKIGEKIAVIDRVGQELEDLSKQLIGDTLFYLAGYYAEDHSFGCVGSGEANNKVRITYINGMLNNLDRCLKAATIISQSHGGINVHYLHSASAGFTWDVIYAMLRKGGCTLTQARLLSELWREMIAEMGGIGAGGTIYHYAHSIGGTDTFLAQSFLTPEEREMIRVVTFGSATLIPQEGFGSVLNVVSYRDGVPFFDPQGYLKSLLNLQSNVLFTGDLFGLPFVDHVFASPSYSSVLDSMGAEFLQFYGML